jgi:hypothetical protein
VNDELAELAAILYERAGKPYEDYVIQKGENGKPDVMGTRCADLPYLAECDRWAAKQWERENEPQPELWRAA